MTGKKKGCNADGTFLSKRDANGMDPLNDRLNPYEFGSRAGGHNFTIRPPSSIQNRSSNKFVNSEMSRH